MSDHKISRPLTAAERTEWLQYAAFCLLIPGGGVLFVSEFMQRNDGYPRGLPAVMAIMIGFFVFLLVIAGIHILLTESFLDLLVWYLPLNLLSALINPLVLLSLPGLVREWWAQ